MSDEQPREERIPLVSVRNGVDTAELTFCIDYWASGAIWWLRDRFSSLVAMGKLPQSMADEDARVASLTAAARILREAADKADEARGLLC